MLRSCYYWLTVHLDRMFSYEVSLLSQFENDRNGKKYFSSLARLRFVSYIDFFFKRIWYFVYVRTQNKPEKSMYTLRKMRIILHKWLTRILLNQIKKAWTAKNAKTRFLIIDYRAILLILLRVFISNLSSLILQLNTSLSTFQEWSFC